MRPAWVLAVLAVGSTTAHAQHLDFSFEGRVNAADSRRSFLDGGLGKLRVDRDNRAQFGRLRLAVKGDLGESWRYVIDASAWSVDDTNPLDLTEAFLEWRPPPNSAWRSRVKLGAFYPPISLEHSAAGWTNPYFISSSALNTWIGEELRTIGAEYQLDWLGTQRNSRFDFGMHAAVYGWNDPAGVVVAYRGFALHDRQTPLFGRLRTWARFGPEQRRIFEEIDDRPGIYFGGHVRFDERVQLRATHYDNRADPAAFDVEVDDYAWETTFNTVGLRTDWGNDWTVMAQWLAGKTYVGPERHDEWLFDTAYVLLAKEFGRHRLAVRYDEFAMTHTRTIFPGTLGRDRGNAGALAWSFEVTPQLDIAAEYLHVSSNYNWRRRIGEQPKATETALQLSVGYRFFAP
jgi:hypothetical protein